MAYQAQPPMIVQQGGNRNAKNIPVTANGRDWSHGMYDCCDDPTTCLIASCVPCVTYGNTKARYEHLQDHGTPAKDAGFVNCDCFLYTCASTCGLQFILQMGNRKRVRARYNIEGGCCGDCFSACCCVPCDLVQQTREVALEEESINQTFGKQGY